MIFYEPSWKSYIVLSNGPIFTPEQCDDIIRVGKSLPQEDAKTGTTKDKRGIKNFKIRKTIISWIPFNKMTEMYASLNRVGNKVNRNYFGFDEIQIGEEAQFTQYFKDGYYDWHTDSSHEMKNEPVVRKISMIVMLSDPKDFEGGELQIVDTTRTISLKRGQAISFASFITHRVLPVKKGNRLSMVVWFTGPPFR